MFLDTGRSMLQSNVVAVKPLRALTGKLVHIASIVYTLRPFLTELHAAIYPRPRGAPRGTVWLKQISHVLTWIIALLDGHPITRHYLLSVHLGRGKRIELNLDASPWGIGGYLLEDGVVTAWFSDRIHLEEARLLRIEIGTSAVQQCVEALAALVALRVWHIRWKQAGAIIRVRSDSISALILTLNLKTSGAGTSIVAREMALDIAWANYQPHVAEHVPGIANKTCDMLSRRFQPGASYELPALLKDVPESKLQPRGVDYYRSAASPPVVQRKWW